MTLRVSRNLFWQLSRDGNLHGSSISHATTASQKTFLRAPWRVGVAVVGRGNAGGTTSKRGHSYPYQNCSQGPPAEKTGRGSLLNHPSCSPDDPIHQGTELKWTELTMLTSVTTILCRYKVFTESMRTQPNPWKRDWAPLKKRSRCWARKMQRPRKLWVPGTRSTKRPTELPLMMLTGESAHPINIINIFCAKEV